MGIPFITMDAHNIVNDNVAQGCGYPNRGQIVEISIEGPVASFETNVAAPLVSLETQIVALQEGSGTPSPENVRPISGFNACKVNVAGKNLLNGEDAKDYVSASFSTSTSGENATGKFYTLMAGYPINGVNMFPWIRFKENTQYTFIVKIAKDAASTSTNLRFAYSDGTYSNISRTSTSSDVTEAEILAVSSGANKTVVGIFGTFASGRTYIYYEHMGVFEGVKTINDYEPYIGHITEIPFGQTVYGGRLNVKTGELTITHGYIDSYNGESINEPWISSIDEYVSGEAPTTDAEVVYPLAEEITVQLSPTEVNTIIGINNISANTGDVKLTFIRVNK